FASCDHVLVQQTQVVGADPETYNVQEALKINQSQYIYIEDSDISGAWDNAVDFVAVQYGHVQGNRIHNAGDWCMYLKGGSAYFRVESNEFFDCGTGGFTAGQGTGFQFMVPPWLHYEAYDIKFINNLIHDTAGAGMGVNGGYNILLAYNTLYRVGQRSHLLEFVFGSRSCDGMPGDPERDRCETYLAAGGWGTTVVGDGTNFVRIPNRNVFVYNNVIYNPPGSQSQWQHFTFPGLESGPSQVGANVPLPTLADENLRIRGNIIWNGPPDHPLGIGEGTGCQPTNPTCNETQLVAENTINTLEPQLIDPAHGNFRPVPGGNLLTATTYAIPAFPGGDQPQPPLAPEGDLSNTVSLGRAGDSRTSPTPPGAYVE
ncbi:MAG: right-handed parallel beta-helix repeat-containing protein, partial [Deinococcus sp.]|nr:right-handed parallel beta-helix repeat-containing protein [Deinococcus sp.]